MIRGFWARRQRQGANCAIDSATKPVLEQLEGRVLLSGNGTQRTWDAGALSTPAASGSHSSVAHTNSSAATQALRARESGLVATIFSANPGWTVDQIRHLYGLDNLDAFNPSLPLYTNSGVGQQIEIIGGDPGRFVNDIPNVRVGNVTRFDAVMGVTTNGNTLVDITLAPLINPLQPRTPQNVLTDFDSASYTTGMIEWAHAMAPQAHIEVVDIPTTPNLGIGYDNIQANHSDVLAGIQEAINNLAPIGGGVIEIPFNTLAEDPTVQAQYDALFTQAQSLGISFIAPIGDQAGAVSEIAASPSVVGIGGTVPVMDALGNRTFETAWVRTGGGPSATEGLPAYQVGVVPVRKGHRTRRGTPDLSLGAIGPNQSGWGLFFDPTSDLSATHPWGLIQSSAGGAAAFTGMVADANELRFTERLNPIGSALPARIYQAFQVAPQFSFTDITLGNNTHQATIGYDYASGLGAPKADGLISSLGDVIGANGINTSFTGDLFFSFNNTQRNNLVVPFTGTGSASFGPFNVGVSFTLTSPSTGGTGTITIPILARNLNGTVSGQGTAHIVVPPTKTGGATYTNDFPILVTGTISRAHKRDIITGTIITVDANGNPVQRGANDVFQGSFHSV